MDKTTKVLLAAIAIGLLVNAFKPAQAGLGGYGGFDIEHMARDIRDIALGQCSNHKLCGN